MEKFIYTTALDKIRKLERRIRVIQGGSSSSKTFSILPVLIDMCAREGGLEVSIVGESVPFLRRGAMKDFRKIMQMTGRWVDDRWNGTLMKYTFHNKSYVEFFSVDDEAKIRGARRNVLFVNECNNIDFDSYHAMAIRTSGVIFLDYNPSHEFWVNEHILRGSSSPTHGTPNGVGGRTLPSDVDFLRLTYKDNEALSASIVAELEKGRDLGFYDVSLGSEEDEYSELFRDENIKNHYWANFWRVFGLGLGGTMDDQIFKNFSVVDGVPPLAKLVGYGLDFGYSADPSAIVAVYSHGGGYYLEEMLYEKSLDYSSLAGRMRDLGIDGTDVVIADSADPRGIDTLRKMGFKGLKPCRKGRDSIVAGITLMSSYPMMITRESLNLLKEIRAYSWDRDKSGKLIPKPVGGFDHLLDGCRYLYLSKIGKTKGFVVSQGRVVHT